ncbi:MarR family winged helix-turn-helix transcriptional regulator [Serinibacter salmoneus]|uniref:MarR family transcriptional regulator n=1 Tax=Serinibacter salmoneus TaxID=556530 RepID=A0A2A9D3Q8_9MICO|nr:MarR family transcriptional regulator [Serinibacter salmoneus]PFG20480.1 MarR family transcriptional regulator [Serinibacter salmoneus]
MIQDAATPTDEVDAIVAAWRAQLPDLKGEGMQVFSRLHRLASHVEEQRRLAFAEHGLAAWQFDVLAALRRAGDPFELTPGALVAQTHVSSGTMTHRIDRLVERELVLRRGSEGDRRIVLVRLTPAGRVAADAAVRSLVARERTVLAALGADGSADLARLLRRLLAQYPDPRATKESSRERP